MLNALARVVFSVQHLRDIGIPRRRWVLSPQKRSRKFMSHLGPRPCAGRILDGDVSTHQSELQELADAEDIEAPRTPSMAAAHTCGVIELPKEADRRSVPVLMRLHSSSLLPRRLRA